MVSITNEQPRAVGLPIARDKSTSMQLHPDLSFCRIESEFVFLNIAQDRYFGLGGELARKFEALMDGSADSGEQASLADQGLVLPGAGNPIAPCATVVPRSSWLDHSDGSFSLPRVAALAWSFTGMRAKLRRHGLAGAFAALTAMRETVPPTGDDEGLAAEVAAYDRLCLLKGTYDLCLPHSLALAAQLAGQGHPAQVVLGVHLRPFGAHAWVEYEGRLVNDRFDRVRAYTPICRL